MKGNVNVTCDGNENCGGCVIRNGMNVEANGLHGGILLLNLEGRVLAYWTA